MFKQATTNKPAYVHRDLQRPGYPQRPAGRDNIKIAVVCVLGVIFTANAYLTAAGKLEITKLKENPFDLRSPVQVQKFQPNAPAYLPPN